MTDQIGKSNLSLRRTVLFLAGFVNGYPRRISSGLPTLKSLNLQTWSFFHKLSEVLLVLCIAKMTRHM